MIHGTFALGAAVVAGPVFGDGPAPGKRPLPEVAFAPPADDPRIRALVSEVSTERMRASVAQLSAFSTRWTLDPDFPAVEDWVMRAFAMNGSVADRIRLQPFAMPGTLTRNNILSGNPSDPRGVILIGAHFDSTSEQPHRLAPGANDNATGVAAMLEIQRILSTQNLDREVLCVAFAGEEQGFIGSTACADVAVAERWPIELMLNLDMLGAPALSAGAPVYIEYDQGNSRSGNDASSYQAARIATEMAGRHTDLITQQSNIYGSDYMPFEARGVPCIGFYDGGDASPHYHHSSDIIENVDFGRLEQVTRLGVATVATIAGLAD